MLKLVILFSAIKIQIVGIFSEFKELLTVPKAICHSYKNERKRQHKNEEREKGRSEES